MSASEGFRSAVLDVWELTEAETVLLDQAASLLDRIVDLENQVAEDGVMVPGSRDQAVLHPAIGEARQSRLAFGRLLAQLNLPDPEGESVWTPHEVRARRAAQARWRRRGSA